MLPLLRMIGALVALAMLRHSLWFCVGSPTSGQYEEQYRSNDYVPEFTDLGLGPQIVAPDTPYVAAIGRESLYFIDTRHDPDTAQHIKNQIEWATIPKPHRRNEIDEIEMTAKVVNSSTGETMFVFDPPYARVLFASQINRWNPNAKLPEHPPAGDWQVRFSHILHNSPRDLFNQDWRFCSQFGCEDDTDCGWQSADTCHECDKGRVDNECVIGQANAIGGTCIRRGCNIKIDTPKKEGESDADYYKRMDELHWGVEEDHSAGEGIALG